MPQLAYSALTAVIFTSAAGALVMCLLVFKYGFAPSPDEPPSAAARRVLITRLGHALAGTCFATAAILGVVALAELSGVAPPATVAYDRFATDERIARLASRVGAVESRLQRADERVRRVEAGLENVGDDLRNAAASRDQAARRRVAAPLPPPVVEPRMALPAPPTPVAPAARAQPPSPPVVAEPRVAASASPPAVEEQAPQPSGFAGARVVEPVSRRPKSAPLDDLGSKVRRDWDVIKRAFATAGTDLRAALDEQARALRDAVN
jgi:hypothetical protein